MNRDTDLPPIRELIKKYSLIPKKSLGQNFLFDFNLTSKIVRQSGDLKGYDILEIGPGPGCLTRSILNSKARRVVVIEQDNRCVQALQELKKSYPDRLVILTGDALKLNPKPFLNKPIKVIANLPYNIGTELLIRFLTVDVWPPYWDSLTLMFQAEVAQRITARVGSKSYGRLSIISQWRTNANSLFSIPANAFFPMPKVSSTVVKISALNSPKFPAELENLTSLVKVAFNQRRKMIRQSLKHIDTNIEKILLECGIDPTHRAEQISLENFCRLSRFINS